MEIKRIKYPSLESFYKFGINEGAVTIEDEEIEDWINEVVDNVKKDLENGERNPYSFVASGNTMVFCFYSQDCESEVFADENYFTVIIAKQYEEGTFTIEDLKKEKTINDIIKNISGETSVFDLGDYEISIRKKE